MIIVDVFNLIYRAIGVSVTKKESELLYGSLDKTFLQIFFRMFNKIYRNFKGSKIYIAWEGKERNFRYSLNPEYKAQRGNSLRDRISENYFDELKEGLRNYGCVVLEYDTAEGDDIIYNLCGVCKDEKEITVISGDTDFIQLLQQFDNVRVYNSMKGKYMERPGYDYVTYKAIRGDSSDNIRGLPGFGEVKSRNVLNNYEAFWNSLNEDSQILISRNLDMIDLSRNPENRDIQDYIRKEISAQTQEFSFKRITEFVMRHQLRDIFSNLNYELDNFIKN